MRVTVHLPSNTEKDLKTFAANQNKSISSVVADSIEFYIRENKRKAAIKNIKGMIGKIKISENALEDIEAMRLDHDRT
jgi:predicted transcriptional regulator